MCNTSTQRINYAINIGYAFALFLRILDFNGLAIRDNFQRFQGVKKFLQKCSIGYAINIGATAGLLLATCSGFASQPQAHTLFLVNFWLDYNNN